MKKERINTLSEFIKKTGLSRNILPSKKNLKAAVNMYIMPRHIKADILGYFLF